ncbi:MAG TPA: hypothetical protein VD861_04565 [Pyrinomonadaceae bacterium]|nr:hypothetical protein [Pyrinomonadaceae bacterium]
MAKTIVSAFDSPQSATRLLASATASGFDSRLFSVISPTGTEGKTLDSLKRLVPCILARLYQKHLKRGDSLLIAQVPEGEVTRLIKLLQSTGGRDIEAFDQVDSS